MMDIAISKKKRLKLPIVQLLAPLHSQPELQISLARTIMKEDLSVNKAKILIRSAANSVDVNPYKVKRKPSHDFAQLQTLVEKYGDQIPLFVDMPEIQFNRMFDSRSETEINVIIGQAKQAVEDMTSLKEVIEEIYEKRFRKKYKA